MIDYYMHEWDDDGYELCVFSDHHGRWILRDWCEENFGEQCYDKYGKIENWAWQAMGDFGNGGYSTIFMFKELENAMALKLRWQAAESQ